MKRLRLAIVSTHPIQYYAPVFRALARSRAVEPRVFFTWSQTADGDVHDPDFRLRFSWNVPLLEGYEHTFVPNVAKQPTSARFNGIKNPTLVRRIEDFGADAVLVYGWNLHSHLAALRHFKGRIPVLFRGDSTLLDPVGRVRSLLRRAWLRWVYRHVDVAIAVGENNRDYYRWSGLPPHRIALAPHSVDTERFRDSSGEHDERARRWRSQLGIPPDAVVFAYAAKFTRKKDPLLLVDTFMRLETSAHLVMLGSGELQPALEARANGAARVHLLPFQNQAEMPTAYRLGDVFVLPSRGPGETWGLALNEAMASGRPVIASSRVGGARDLVRTGITGWLFEAGDSGGLSAAMRAALAIGRGGIAHVGGEAQRLSCRSSSEAAADGIALAVGSACGAPLGAIEGAA